MQFLVWMLLAAEPAAWRSVATERELGVLMRKVEGSPHEEIRIQTLSHLGSAALCRAAYGDGSLDPAVSAPVVEHRVLREEAGARVVYERIKPILVAERDYTLAFQYRQDESGGCSVEFSTANELAPSLRPGVVRLTRIKGAWRVTPRADGRAELLYDVWTDPGNAGPLFLVERARRDSALESVRLALRRAAERDGK